MTIKQVKQEVNNILFNEVKTKYVNLYNMFTDGTTGCRFKGTNILLIDESIRGTEEEKRVLYHELGHYIHEEYLYNFEYRMPSKGKSNYAYKSHLEDFAEAIADFMTSNPETTERNNYICKVLKVLFTMEGK